MENGQVIKMIEHYTYNGEDFKTVMTYDGWKIGILRNSERFSSISHLWERHHLTDEAFVLLEGSAVLYASNDDGEVEKLEMQPCTVYNIPKDIWHHIIVADENTTVLVVENSNTSKSNTERILP